MPREDSDTQFVIVILGEDATKVPITYLYRGDGNPTELVFQDGFKARGTNLDVFSHVNTAGHSSSDSGFVSTSESPRTAAGFPKGRGNTQGFLYEINAQAKAVDVGKALLSDVAEGRLTLGQRDLFKIEQEMAVPFAIHPKDIKGAWPIDIKVLDKAKLHISEETFIPNPVYVKPGVLQAAQAIKIAGHGMLAAGAILDGFELLKAYRSGDSPTFFNAAAEIAARWSGAIVVGTSFAQAGASLCAPLAPPWGSLACSVGISIVGSVLGSIGGAEMFNRAVEGKRTAENNSFLNKQGTNNQDNFMEKTTNSVEITNVEKNSDTRMVGLVFGNNATDIPVMYLYRGTTKNPAEAFLEGFTAKGSHLHLHAHVDPEVAETVFGGRFKSAYVSTSTSKEAAKKFPYVMEKSSKAFLYEINPQSEGVNIFEKVHHQLSGEYREMVRLEQEVAVPLKISPEHIKGAWVVDITQSGDCDIYHTEGVRTLKEPFVENPIYRKPGVLRAAQAVKIAGRGVAAVGVALDGVNLLKAFQESEKSGNYRTFLSEGARIIAGWTGAIALGAPLAKAGAAVCAPLGPVASLSCGFVSAIIGSGLGYTGGSEALRYALKEKKPALPNPTFVTHKEQVDQRLSGILEEAPNSTPPAQQTIDENNRFLKEQGAENIALSHAIHHKLNAILRAQKASYEETKRIYQQEKASQNSRDKIQKEQDEIKAIYQGSQTGFQAIQQLGVLTENQTIAKIGAIGAASASIAFNVAALTGAIPGLAFSGLGLMVPYAGIALAGIAILSTLFAKPKEDKATKEILKALQALSKQIDELRKEIHQHLDEISQQMRESFQKLEQLLNNLFNITHTMISNEFRAMRFTLDVIQEDLKRLSEFAKTGLYANYLQDFEITDSAIRQFTNMTGNRETALQDKLVNLTTWLTRTSMIKNTNGHWTFPAAISSDNAFAPLHLRHHAESLNGESSLHLGYLAALSNLIPGVTFSQVSLEAIPNIALFTQGVETYLLGRLRLGAAAQAFDPHQVSLTAIKETAENGLRWLAQLQAQERILLNHILAQYEARYNALCEAIKLAALDRLKTGTVLGFEPTIQDPLNASLPWPATLTPTQAGYPALPFDRVRNTILSQPSRIPRILQKAIKDLALGKIVAYYSCNCTAATIGAEWGACGACIM